VKNFVQHGWLLDRCPSAARFYPILGLPNAVGRTYIPRRVGENRRSKP
jgi:hypothetical protein